MGGDELAAAVEEQGEILRKMEGKLEHDMDLTLQCVLQVRAARGCARAAEGSVGRRSEREVLRNMRRSRSGACGGCRCCSANLRIRASAAAALGRQPTEAPTLTPFIPTLACPAAEQGGAGAFPSRQDPHGHGGRRSLR